MTVIKKYQICFKIRKNTSFQINDFSEIQIVLMVYRNWSLSKNFNFLTLISLSPYGVKLWYFTLGPSEVLHKVAEI